MIQRSSPTEPRLIQSGAGSGADIRPDVSDRLLEILGATVPVVFYYPTRLDPDVLASALSRALARYPLFAGRLRVDGRTLTAIACNDAGARFSTATVDVDLAHAIGALTTSGEPWIVDLIDPLAARSGKEPLFSVRVSHLRDGTTALGCCWHHALGDMGTFMGLMRAWAAALVGGPMDPPLIVPDRRAYFAAHIPDDCHAPPGVRVIGWGELAKIASLAFLRRKRTVQVYFGDAELDRMRAVYSSTLRERARAGGRADSGAAPHLTRNDVVCAHAMALLRDLDLGGGGGGETRGLSIAVDVRRRLGLATALAGNLISQINVPVAPTDSAETVALHVHDAVAGYAREHNSYHATVRFAEALPAATLKRCLSLGLDPVRKTLMVTNWSRFGVYDLAFGGATPVLFSPVSQSPVPWIAGLVEGFGGRGLLLTAMLPATLAAVVNDPANAARVHPFRHASDALPALARSVAGIV